MADATSKKRGGILDAIEWVGNKLPDPAFLFLIGAVLVMVASHFAAPSLPDGYRVGWTEVGNALGKVDEHVSHVERPKRDAAGQVVKDEDGKTVYERLKFEVPTGPDDEVLTGPNGSPMAYLAIEGAEGPDRFVTDEAGAPIDFAKRGWAVFSKEPVKETDEAGEETMRLVPTGRVTFATSLLTSEGLYFCLSSMESNFLGFAPLGVVLLGMLGIGVTEKTGLIAALLKLFTKVVPQNFLTPAMVFIGIMSSLATDAGYVVLPPLAAAIYLAAGRSPLVGIAAVFAGVSAGFNANLLITSLEPLMAELTQEGAQLVDPTRQVAATANWWFLIASTFVITGAGWLTTALFIERRLEKKSPDEGGPDHSAAALAKAENELTAAELKGVMWSGMTLLVFVVVALAMSLIPGGPLHGLDGIFPRWVAVVVPLMFFGFLLPGLVFGMCVGNVRSTKDAAKHMIDSMAGMAPIIVLAFFAGQFVAYFGETNLGEMLAFSGGAWLFEQQLSPMVLIVAFILLTMVFNMFVGSMSAKYTLFAPIFVPMFMLIGIRPELTQIAYRIGDSVTNIITPLNAYLVIILVFMQKYAPKSGMGTLIAMMFPYTIVFAIIWTILLLIWVSLGIPLGMGDPGTV